MKPTKTIKYKALFLLITFSLNSVVGFACSLGVYMGFNTGHHAHSESEKHGHEHSPKSHKKEQKAHQHNKHNHADKHAHKHDHAKGHKHGAAGGIRFKKDGNDNCCTEYVIGFQSLEKALPQTTLTDIAKSLCLPFVLPGKVEWQVVVYVEPIRNPPKILHSSPPDIRVFIRSFQI